MGFITSDQHLPVLGATENIGLDFKVTYKRSSKPAFDQFEIAKDVAALANAMGGTLLIGAQEDASTGALRAYVPLDAQDQKDTAQAIEHSVRNRCSPVPVVSIAPILHGIGALLAVNITAYPGQPVGAAVRADRTDGYGDTSWTFPMRVGTQTTFLRPEQLAMLMSAEYRRVAVMLSEIRPNDEVLVTWRNRGFGHEPRFSFISMSATDNLVVLASKLHKGQIMRLPLDAVRSVWRDGAWFLLFEGLFQPREDRLEFYRT